MFCKKCGYEFNENDVFCKNCGTRREFDEDTNTVNEPMPLNQNTVNTNNTQVNINEIPQEKKKNNTLLIIGGVVVALIAIAAIINNNKNGNDNYLDDNNIYNNYNNNSGNNNNNNNNSSVKGTYTREVFSGNSFNYITAYDTAVFTFNTDSTFEVKYDGGNTYVGTYEIYNGFNITAKCGEIKRDSSIQYGEELADSINKIWTGMTSNTQDIVNTYLIWIKLNDGVTIQPFVIKYDPDQSKGIAINVMAQLSGDFVKR